MSSNYKEKTLEDFQNLITARAEVNEIPEFIEIENRGSHVLFKNINNGKEHVVPLFAYSDVLKALNGLF